MMILVPHSGRQETTEVSSVGPALCVQNQCAPGKGNTKVTIYHGTDCKLSGVAREGELLGRRRRPLRGQPCIAAKGNGMSGGRIASRKGGRPLALSAIVLGAVLALFGSADRAGAADRRGSSSGVFVSETNGVQHVKVILNKSRSFKVERPFATIVAGNPDIAEVKPRVDRAIYVLGKQTGTTNIVLFDDAARQIGVLDVEVAIDTSYLQQNIQSSTGTRGIRVSSSEGQVVLSGTA